MKKATAIILILLAISILGFANADSWSLDHIYPTTAVVRELDHEHDIVITEDCAGTIWTFDGIEDWCEGDIVSYIMYDNMTPYIEDDIIIDLAYSGYMPEDWEV